MRARVARPSRLKASLQITETGGRDVDEFLAAEPRRKSSRSPSRHPGMPKAQRGPSAPIVKQQRTSNRGNERAGVNRKIKPAEHLREKMLVRFAKLVADIGRDARLDAAGAEQIKRDRAPAWCDDQTHAPEVSIQGKGETGRSSKRSRARKWSDICQENLRRGWLQESEGNKRRDEKCEILSASRRPCDRREHADLLTRLMGHEDDQDRLHPVEVEPLGRFVADDVGHARRHAAEVRRRSERICVWPWRCCFVRARFASR